MRSNPPHSSRVTLQELHEEQPAPLEPCNSSGTTWGAPCSAEWSWQLHGSLVCLSRGTSSADYAQVLTLSVIAWEAHPWGKQESGLLAWMHPCRRGP